MHQIVKSYFTVLALGATILGDLIAFKMDLDTANNNLGTEKTKKEF